MTFPDNITDVKALKAFWAETKALQGSLHLPDVRDAYRLRLEQLISHASLALEKIEREHDLKSLYWVLAQAHTARAEDARYGAGQLSRGAQRAPTLADCEDGWLRVEEIVNVAEQAAHEIARIFQILDLPKVKRQSDRAESAAQAARSIVSERNRAYTFHADPGFSFGEGWYLAAAALFADLFIQIRPGARQEEQARRFLVDAGLADALLPYRSRPASPKHLTHIIAEAFRVDSEGAQKCLRAAFLGKDGPSAKLKAWIADKMTGHTGQKVLLWIRSGDHDVDRNTCFDELQDLVTLVLEVGLIPVFFGDAIPADIVPSNGIDLTLCWKESLFQGPDMRRAQLLLFEELRYRHDLIGQVGVTTAGMDGPALMGLATMYLTQEPNVRLGKWVGAVPGYEEVVRRPGFLDIMRRTLCRWRSSVTSVLSL